jgi:hypothetical protein
MTHDELLAKITTEMFQFDRGLPMEYMQALRAVVELHKPWYRPGLTKSATVCAICYTDEGIRVFYPCATIQAIEKELG